VPEIVEADVGETRFLEERSQAPLAEIGRIDKGPDLGGKHEALVNVESKRSIRKE
jgi:hypothetical protein